MKNTKTFRQQILSMNAGQIIMAMVNGLEKPKVTINMGTYGKFEDGICYGCAATNAVCKIAKVKFTSKNIGYRFSRAKTIKSSENFLHLFENAIDSLRWGDIDGYNFFAKLGKFRRIKNPNNLDLPMLYNHYTQEHLNVYKQLAKTQRK